MKSTMGVKLDEEMRERLKVLGEKRERSPHWLMKRAIQEYLNREEAFDHEKQEDLQRRQQYMNTGKYISHDEMRGRLTELAADARKNG